MIINCNYWIFLHSTERLIAERQTFQEWSEKTSKLRYVFND